VAVRLLDTNIVSYLLKNHPLATRYRPHLAGHTLAVAFMTAAELYAWGRRARWGPGRWARLDATLGGFLVIHSDDALCRQWAEVRHLRAARPIDTADAWIAAAALVHGLELVTHNPADFHGIPGLTVISEAP
jgi:predicted nucleic acid-binding protein